MATRKGPTARVLDTGMGPGSDKERGHTPE